MIVYISVNNVQGATGAVVNEGLSVGHVKYEFIMSMTNDSVCSGVDSLVIHRCINARLMLHTVNSRPNVRD